MKSIFLSLYENNIKRVFSEEIRNFIVENCENSGDCYSKEDILKIPEIFKDIEVIFSTWDMPQFTEEEIKQYLPSLKYIFYAAGTVQYFAKPFLNCGVRVFSAWVANAVPVAEYTVAQIVLANKGYFVSSRLVDSSDYRKKQSITGGFIGNYGAKIGIIGAGMIGSLVIKMLKAYNLDVLVFDPFLSDEKALDLGVEKCSLEELFASCNVVSNHLANNEQTKDMLNYSLFSKMPENATFLNTGRGAQVNENDLVRILTERQDITAILDVTEPEPPIDDSPIYKLENCILTPHIAGSSGKEVGRMAEYMLNEYLACVENKALNYEITLEMLKTMA